MTTQAITTRSAALETAPPQSAAPTAAQAADEQFALLLRSATDRVTVPAPQPAPPTAPPVVTSSTSPVPVAPAPTAPPPLATGVITPGTIGALLAAAGSSGSAAVADTLARLIGSGTTMPVPPTTNTSSDITLGGDMEQRRATLQPLFEAAGARYGVDPDLLAAVAWTESGFQPDVVSHAGAIGLMQIMPGTAEGLGVDPRDPAQAIDGAARYLRDAFDQFGDVRLALAAYNAGPGAVASHGGIPPYPETTAYVATVMDRYESLRGAST